MLKDAGIEAERVPLSGACGGTFAGDILIRGRRYEAKIRCNGFLELYKWIDGNHGVILRADRREGLVVLRVADWIELMKKG